MSLHKKSNHIFSRIIVKGIFFPNTTTQQQRLHITTPTTNPTIRKIRIVNMSVLFEYNFSFPFIPHYLPKCHLPHSLSKTTFFPRPAAHPLKIRKQNRLSNTKKQHNRTNAHTTSKQKSNSNATTHKKPKAKPSKRQSKTIHQVPPTRKHPHPNSHPNPPNIRTTPSQKPYTPKRKDVSPQTQVHFTPNAEEFASKRKGVSPKTQGRFTTNASPFSTPKSPDNSPSCLPKHPKIP